MLRSIRWTLQIWHAAILLLVLLGFGFASYYEVSRTRFMEVDAELSGVVHVLAAYLVPPPRRPAPAPPRREDDEGPPGPARGAAAFPFRQFPDQRLRAVQGTSTPGQSGAGGNGLAESRTPRRPGFEALPIRGGAASRLPAKGISLAPLAPAWRSLEFADGSWREPVRVGPALTSLEYSSKRAGDLDDSRASSSGLPDSLALAPPSDPIGPPDGPEGGGPPRPFDGPPRDQRPPQREPPPRREPPSQRQGEEPGPEAQSGRPAPQLDLPVGFLDRYGESNPDRPFFAIRRSDGSVIKAVGESPDRPELTAATPADGIVRYRQWADLREAVLTTPLGAQIIAGRSVRREQDQLRELVFLLAGTGAGILALGLGGGWFLSRRVVRPIGVMSATAQALSATHLSGRIEVDRVPSELGLLAQVLNAAFARLESAFLQQARFTADASHELRTPLSVIHSHAELALSRERSNDEYRHTLATCLKASTRMRSLVESLLLLARADAGGLELTRQSFDLGKVARECVALLTPLAQQGGIDLQAALGTVEVTGDPSRIGQVITNLVTNAIRYNHAGGMVRISTEWANGAAVLTVADTGMGIAPEDQPRVFERFFRADKARSRKAGGSGLGLAICKSIIDAHAGSIAFSSLQGQGTTFVVRLPAQASALRSV